MKAFDTDILTEILRGNPAYAVRLLNIPLEEQTVSIVSIEEIIRGRLNVIRRAESTRSQVSVDQAYARFERTLADLRQMKVLSFPPEAQDLVKAWRTKKVKGSTHDLRIAATCVANSTSLVTRNRRDFQNIPGLSVEFWD